MESGTSGRVSLWPGQLATVTGRPPVRPPAPLGRPPWRRPVVAKEVARVWQWADAALAAIPPPNAPAGRGKPEDSDEDVDRGGGLKTG